MRGNLGATVPEVRDGICGKKIGEAAVLTGQGVTRAVCVMAGWGLWCHYMSELLFSRSNGKGRGEDVAGRCSAYKLCMYRLHMSLYGVLYMTGPESI